MARNQPIEIFMPPNVLKAKAGSPGGFDADVIQRAEAAMRALKGNFADWLADDVAKLAASHMVFLGKQTVATRDRVFRVAHDLKGQAATFGFPIIARIASSLTKLLDDIRSPEAVPASLVEAHVAAIRVAFRDKVKAVDDVVATTLAGELEARVAATILKFRKLAA